MLFFVIWLTAHECDLFLQVVCYLSHQTIISPDLIVLCDPSFVSLLHYDYLNYFATVTLLDTAFCRTYIV